MPFDDEADGGQGHDLLDLGTASTTRSTVDLAAGTLTGQGSDDVARIEEVTGGDGSDDLTGGDEANNFFAGPGDDLAIRQRRGNDSIDLGEDGGAGGGGEGNDRVVGGSGGGGPGRDVLIGTGGPNALAGGAGRDLIRARGGDDTIESPSDDAASAGSDVIVAGAGFDTVYAVRGSDSIAAGPDVDALVYGGGVPGALVVDLAAGTTTGALQQEHSNFEFVSGTAHDDILRGTDGPK